MQSSVIYEALGEIIREEAIEEHKISFVEGLEKGDNYTGDIYKVVIVGKKHGRETALNVIVKKSHTDPILRKTLRLHKSYTMEAYVYSVLLPTLDKLQRDAGLEIEESFTYAKLYKSDTREGDEYLIFEDLSLKNFKMYDRHLPYDSNHLMLAIRAMARYHAALLVLKDKHFDKYEEAASNVVNLDDIKDMVKAMVDKSKSTVTELRLNESCMEKIVKLQETMYEDLINFWKPETAEPYNVICHGDCWSNNMMFKYQNNKLMDVIIIDWQTMIECSPLIDLAYLMFLSSDRQLRANHYEQAIEVYYETLKHNVTRMGTDIDKCYPEKVYRDHVNRMMKYGLIMALVGLGFALGDKGEAVGIENVESGGIEVVMPTNERLKKRLKDIIEDSVVYGIL